MTDLNRKFSGLYLQGLHFLSYTYVGRISCTHINTYINLDHVSCNPFPANGLAHLVEVSPKNSLGDKLS